MNLKKTAIALAVATVAATPILASADGSVYASVRYGFESMKDFYPDAVPSKPGKFDRVSQFGDFGSRWGIKGETDLGNGITAFGHWEASMFNASGTDADDKTGIALRDYKIGLKGGFGTVYMGESIDHAWDTYMTPDVAWWYGGSQKLTDGVQGQAITYMNDFGVVSMAVTAQMSGGRTEEAEQDVDTFELAVGFDAGPVNIAVGLTESQNKVNLGTTNNPVYKNVDPIFGFVVKGEAGSFNYSVELQAGEETGDVLTYTGTGPSRTVNGTEGGLVGAFSYQLEAGVAGFYAQYGATERDSTDGTGSSAKATTNETSALVLGYTLNIGPRTLMYFEYRDKDGKNNGVKDKDYDESVFAAVLKYDIL